LAILLGVKLCRRIKDFSQADMALFWGKKNFRGFFQGFLKKGKSFLNWRGIFFKGPQAAI